MSDKVKLDGTGDAGVPGRGTPGAGLLIGELAAATGASARSLRHYEALGLITSARRVNGYRVFDRGTVAVVGRIRRLLAAGFTLDAVAVILPCVSDDAHTPVDMCPVVASRIRDALSGIETETRRLALRREAILRLAGPNA